MTDVTTGYVQGPGGFYKQSDRSGPYTIDSAGTATLLGGSGGGGGGDASAANQATQIASQGAVGDAAWSSGNGSIIALLKTMATQALSTTDIEVNDSGAQGYLSSIETKTGALTETAPASDIASSGINGRLQRIAQRITSAITLLAGGLPAALAAGGGLKIEGVAGGVAQPVSGTVSLTDISAAEYETVAASATAQVLGATGATGDYVSGLLVVPANVNPGNVLLLDNATSITVFAGGTASVSNLVPFFIPLGMKSVSGAWKVTTGASVSVIGVGNFT